MNRFRTTRESHASETAEDYVELIDTLIVANGEARAVEMARRMGVSQVTVGRTLERLRRDGLVDWEPYRSIRLTDAGTELAQRARERHQVVLNLLLRLGVDPTTAEVDAEGIEHHVSETTLQAIRRFLASE